MEAWVAWFGFATREWIVVGKVRTKTRQVHSFGDVQHTNEWEFWHEILTVEEA
jgi:hypothetical protein